MATLFWALAALVVSVAVLGVTVWFWRGHPIVYPEERPPPPQGFANLIDAEWDFVELEIWEDVFEVGFEGGEEKRGRGEEETEAPR